MLGYTCQGAHKTHDPTEQNQRTRIHEGDPRIRFGALRLFGFALMWVLEFKV